MLSERRKRAALASVVLIFLATACSPGEEVSTQPTRSPTIEPRPVTSPPVEPSAEETASQAAEQAVADYYRVTDALLGQGQLPIEQAAEVATGAELDAVRQLLQQRRGDGRRQTGSVVVEALDVTGLGLTPPASADVRVCLDVSGVDVVDTAGASVVLPDRHPRTVIDLGLLEQPDVGWVVEQVTSEGLPCEPS